MIKLAMDETVEVNSFLKKTIPTGSITSGVHTYQLLTAHLSSHTENHLPQSRLCHYHQHVVIVSAVEGDWRKECLFGCGQKVSSANPFQVIAL